MTKNATGRARFQQVRAAGRVVAAMLFAAASESCAGHTTMTSRTPDASPPDGATLPDTGAPTDGATVPDAPPEASLVTCTPPAGSQTVTLHLSDAAKDIRHLGTEPPVGFNAEVVSDTVVAGDSVYTSEADDLAPGAQAALGTFNAKPDLYHPWIDGAVLRIPGGTPSDVYDWEDPNGFFPPTWVTQHSMSPAGAAAVLRGKGGVRPGDLKRLLDATKTKPLYDYTIVPYTDATGHVVNTTAKAARFMTSSSGLPAGSTWGSYVNYWELNNEPWTSTLAWAWKTGGDYIKRAELFHGAMAPKTHGKFLVASGNDAWNSSLLAASPSCWWQGVVVHPYYAGTPSTFSQFRADTVGWLKSRFDTPGGRVAAVSSLFAKAYPNGKASCSDIYITETGLMRRVPWNFAHSAYAGVIQVESVLRFQAIPHGSMLLFEKLIAWGNGVVQQGDGTQANWKTDYHYDEIANAGLNGTVDTKTTNDPHPAGYDAFYLAAPGVMLSVAFPAWTAATDTFNGSTLSDTDSVPYIHGPNGSGTVNAVFARLYERCTDSGGKREPCATSGATVARHYLILTNKSSNAQTLKFTLDGQVVPNGSIIKYYAAPSSSAADVNSTSHPARVATNGLGCIEADSSAILIPPSSVVRLEW